MSVPVNSSLESIVLVIPVLCGGGAERCISNMANWWAAQGVRVFLITFRKDVQAYKLDSRIEWLGLDQFHSTTVSETEWFEENYNIACLRKAFEYCLNSTKVRPLPLISFLARMNLRTILAVRGLPYSVVVSERTYPPMNPFPQKEESLRLELYKQAHKVIVQTNLARDLWGDKVVPKAKLGVIPNSVSDEFCLAEIGDCCGDKVFEFGFSRFIVTAGRLEPEKQFDRFIDVFSLLAPEYPELRGLIIGGGSLRQELHERVKSAGLSDRLHMFGALKSFANILRLADLFVLTSKFEGFPNVLLESMACGCPVVSYNCLAGPSEIIRNGVDGILVSPDDEDFLFSSIKTLLDDEVLRLSMGKAAKDVCRRFNRDDIMLKWESLFL
ncbi:MULTISPECIES: glycosyltransferase [unclassified Maridesulfovibrio]|uniref:glycosyltransferase n=1 Tax=unclassified Maridesulfovibrio TaxID=2794999 RepID=UPI003B3C9658